MREARPNPKTRVNKDKNDSFNAWYAVGEMQQGTVELHGGGEIHGSKGVTVNWKWFKIVMTPDESIYISHVNAYVHLLRRHQEVNPKLFKGGIYFCFLHMSLFLASDAWDKFSEHPDGIEWEKWCPKQMETVREWTNSTRALVLWPYSMNRWLTVEMDIRAWTLRVYDCAFLDGQYDAISTVLNKWCHILPRLFVAVGALKATMRMKTATPRPFDVYRVPCERIPQHSVPICN